MEIVRHRVAVIEVVRHDEVADIQHYFLGTVCKDRGSLYVVVVDMILYFAGLPGERLEVRSHQFDVNGIVVLPSDGELVSRIGLL